MGQSCKDLGSEDNSMLLLMAWIFYTESAENKRKEKTSGTRELMQ